ncbi:Gfo/Idh/MocA family oxidoreductase [Winogradskyella sp. SM1960]|uniref:Gfo/Idh/MocA family oxidoreductase n=1 Tax=Winogradskyella sp. SM1960 TaxID=2865955 RepID=UPI001CD293F1|nr:Gfo/Idh/MocA family oxidoreductase [Winogradskyella sp. SM1960]
MGKIRFGVIGMSEGNGHPYSWSAIFNGFNKEAMANCPFPGIPEYLNKRSFPEDFLTEQGCVTHIYTQDFDLSKEIALASNIAHIVSSPEDMICEVDAILLATDDGENHYKMAKPFIEAGLPIYIDKPFAISIGDALRIYEIEKYPKQIFTCSALRFANELILTSEEREALGSIIHVEASVPKKWDTYAIHVIEPIVSQLPLRGKLLDVKSIKKNGFHHSLIEWENTAAYIKTTGSYKSPISFTYHGKNNTSVNKVFVDSFSCFKNALNLFTTIINRNEDLFIDQSETLEIIEIIDKGRK